jgi:hypothetical protein
MQLPQHNKPNAVTHLQLCILEQRSDASHGLAQAQQCTLAGSSSGINSLLAGCGHHSIKGSHLGAQQRLQLRAQLGKVWQQLGHAVNSRLQQSTQVAEHAA